MDEHGYILKVRIAEGKFYNFFYLSICELQEVVNWPVRTERRCFAQSLKFRFYINYFSDHSEINFAILFNDYFRVLVIH